MVNLIQKKRDGLALSEDEIRTFVQDYTNGKTPDYQMSALLMAIYFKGLSAEETLALTRAMWRSGITLEKRSDAIRIDKHSTGGVGDKTSLILVPWLSAAVKTLLDRGQIERSVHLPMISGRGLGFTGGTLDKLDAIPGFRTGLSIEESLDTLDRIGSFIVGQTGELAPADRKIYALRDATATVESIPLIVASILSKKFSAGLDGLVLDIKVGPGSFMVDLEIARQLTRELLHVCRLQGVKCEAILTRMEEPLGCAVGHRNEIEECVLFLRGSAREQGLAEVCYALAVAMLDLATQRSLGRQACQRVLEETLSNGDALKSFSRLVSAQGGNWSLFEKERGKVHRSAVKAPRSGCVASVDARAIASVLRRIGGGRDQATDAIDPDVGIWIRKKVGDTVLAGEPVAELEGVANDQLANVTAHIGACFSISDREVPKRTWVLDTQKNF